MRGGGGAGGEERDRNIPRHDCCMNLLLIVVCVCVYLLGEYT